MTDQKYVMGWAIVNRSGDVIVSTTAQTRADAINAMVGIEIDKRRPRWRRWKQWGCRAIKVRIVPDPTP